MAQSLADKATRGVIWSAIERFSVQGIMFVLTLIIARLVTPAEYGLIAMLNIFVAVAQVFVDSGFSNALVQKKDRNEDDFSTVFYFNIAISLVVYFLLYLASPYIADFYNEPQLDLVTKCVGLNLIISGLTIVQRAKLTIELDFKTQAKAALLGVVLGGAVGIAMAYRGYGVWSLVAQTLSSSGITTLFLWFFARWHPRLHFSMESFRSLFSFGSKLLLSGIIYQFYINLYSLVIGRRYSAVDVGYYNQASLFSRFPSENLMMIISRVIYPLLSELQDDDERLKRAYIQSLRMSCFIIFPLMVGLAAVSEPLLIVLLTDKWLSAALPLSILSLGYMFAPYRIISNRILNAKRRSDYTMQVEILKSVIGIAILFATMPFGLNILCCGMIVYNVVGSMIIIIYTKRVMPMDYFLPFRETASIFTISIAMGAVSYFLPSYISDNTHMQLLIGIVSGVATYVGLSYILRISELGAVFLLAKKHLSIIYRR